MSKSKIYSYNLSFDVVQAASSFLACGICTLSFVFLGIPIGINLRRKKVWKPILEKLRTRLLDWHNRNISMGGRVALLNVTLENILIFLFSFHKAPKCIIKEIIIIQKSFLSGGLEDVKKISWLKWSKVCLSKKKLWLGVKHYGIFNLALLSK
ncbi:uncharacterized protein LOC131604102 [Vicia villosa]|uniref:uncharacterized protein LOC131604102 n=1 Tax=Vicia villosa TaxID=3911 RepID=UPI00273CA348|nr:uncharacterized protein LOC131604102 [Vicia villosa]